MQEIVGARIGTIITNKKEDICQAIQSNTVSEFLDRRRMQFMAGADLGQNWIKMATGATLFIIDDNGDIQSSKNQNQKTITNQS